MSTSTVPAAADSRSSSSPAQSLSRHAARRRSLELVAEAQGDVDGFVKEIEAKRRQLDEQIHKFISQKEREFKLYERELRIRYRTAATDSPATTASDESVQRKDDPDSPMKRETELLGLFTPAYLPLLDSRPPAPARSPSAPPLTDTPTDIVPDRQALHRANTDPACDNKPHSIRIALGHRTPSSGSDTGKSLVSALKSPSALPKPFNKKRVSLIVGDAVVAPSDNVHLGLPEEEQSSTQRHAVVQPSPQTPLRAGAVKSQPLPAVAPQNTQPGGLSLGFASATQAPGVSNGITPTNINATSAEGDLEIASPFAMDEEFDSMTSQEMYTTQIEDIDADIDSGLDSESTLREPSPDKSEAKHTSPESPIPKIEASSSASAQPIAPGFSRPSVKRDPELEFDDPNPQDTLPPNSIYDSFTRPSYGMQSIGSLGESFMAKNAEKMMRRRQSAQQRS